ncbi:MAG: hypothetical protein HETSPECPRED_009493 [Heterodermia speciosa]|uniref:NADAR domain-containing protein n=1 Tax=Heterodermia speciosa TaxID=116794 RepID=A0A8H3EN32_9LECA|nr:MAG: hypothetical protein HETSPECPRED_009493 [Heterodermia speciosa]
MSTSPSTSASPSPLATTTDLSTPIYFWREYSSEPHAFLSQWYRVPFLAPLTPCQTPTFSPPSTPPTASDMQIFQTAEQYMMYRKAILFEDAHIAAKVLQTPDPRKQKALGRKVEGFEPAKWDVWKEGIVEEGNYYKFTNPQSPKSSLRSKLLQTGDSELVEASPFDRIWGIGFKAAEAGEMRERWGENLLGKALGRVRGWIRGEGGGVGKNGEGGGVEQKGDGR